VELRSQKIENEKIKLKCGKNHKTYSQPVDDKRTGAMADTIG